MSEHHEDGPELFQLGRDHTELLGQMNDLSTQLARLEGKIDTQTALLNNVTARQDRSEKRVDDLERDMRKEIDKAKTESSNSVKDVDKKTDELSRKVWMGIGGLGFVAIFPSIFKILQAIGAS